MQIRFANPAWRWVFLAAVLLIAATLFIPATKSLLAEKWAASSQPDNWLRAAQLQPGNADIWYRLGRYRHLDFERADLPLAISYYRRAVAIDPRSAFYWMDLGSAYELAGDSVQALQAFETAKAAYPISGEVAWRYGNFLLRQGRLPEAFAEIRRALENDPQLATLAISRSWRSSRDIRRILDEALPVSSDIYLATLDFLVAEQEADAALAVWKRLLALRSSFELRRALPLLDELIRQERVDEAKTVWQQALGIAAQQPQTRGGSLVWDGGFEGEFTGGGFGWRKQAVEGAAVGFDTATHHGGTRSLRVTFDGGANLYFCHVAQLVPVEPRTRYRFAAYLRTEELSTDSGIRFLITDPRRPGELDVLTPNLVGTQPWALDEIDFTAGPQTHVVKLALCRLPSQKLDNRIRGMVWVDDVSLLRLAEPAGRRAP